VSNSEAPKVFLSHSWADKEKVRPLAERLHTDGIDVWFDEWEIRAGDSLVQKIDEGLQGCEVFLVAISEQSVNSRWVREEMSSAIVRRIEERTRLIPIRVDSTPLPTVINHLIWIPLEPLDDAVRKIEKEVFGISNKPPIGKRPDYIEQGLARQQNSIAGLGPEASAVLRELVKQARQGEDLFWIYVNSHLLQDVVGLDEIEIEDALDVLNERGLIEFLREGSASALVRPRPRAWIYVADDLDIDLTKAMQRVAACAVSQGRADIATLERETGLPFEPLKTAVFVLGELDLIDVFHGGFGNRPYNFVYVTATRKTREWVKRQEHKL
jgi:hypothetical protein